MLPAGYQTYSAVPVVYIEAEFAGMLLAQSSSHCIWYRQLSITLLPST